MADGVAAIERSMCARYQPIVEIDGGRVAGCEALARWRGEDGTLASIGPLADAIEQDEDLATALTARMLECVDRDLLDLLIRNPSFYVSINLPPITLGRERLRPVRRASGSPTGRRSWWARSPSAGRWTIWAGRPSG